MDDEALAEGFDRLVRLSRPSAPSLGELQGRVHRRQVRRRRRHQAVLGACAVVLVAAGLGLSRRPSGPDPEQRLQVADPTTTAQQPDGAGPPVFTVSRLPEGLAFRACTPEPRDDGPTGVTCTFDNPATGQADGVRITRVVDGATPELRQAWADGEPAAAAEASGGSDDPAAAAFRTLEGTTVLDLAPRGEPSSEEDAAVRVIVGDDLIDLGTSNVTMPEVGRIVLGLSMGPAEPEVTEALGALPAGSVALVQGERPLWVQPDAIDPTTRRRFPGTTVGTEIAVPGSASLVGVDITDGIDADAFLDELLASGTPGLFETEIADHRAVVLDLGDMMPISVPEPRPGPQILVATDTETVVRVKDPDGSADVVRSIAEALS